MNFNEQVYALVRLIPHGKVINYGRVAALLDNPRGARAVGWALAALPDGTDVPWHRVVNSQRRVSPRYPGDDWHRQRALFQPEDIAFDPSGQIPNNLLLHPPMS